MPTPDDRGGAGSIRPKPGQWFATIARCPACNGDLDRTCGVCDGFGAVYRLDQAPRKGGGATRGEGTADDTD